MKYCTGINKRGSQPMVREGRPGGTRVTSIFFTKTWIHSFLVYVLGFVSKEIDIPIAAIPIVS